MKNKTDNRHCSDKLLALHSACATISSSLDLGCLLETVAREMAGLLKVEACATYAWNHEHDTLSLLSHFGTNGRWETGAWAEPDGPADHALAKGALVDRRPQQLSTGQPDLCPADRAYLGETGAKTLVLLPMVSQDRVIGLAELMDSVERVFPDRELALAQRLANHAASSIENARLFDEMRRRVEELTTLNLISQVFVSSLDLHETLATVADYTIRLLGGAAASIALHDRIVGDVWFAAASGRGSDFVRNKRLALGTGIIGWTIERGESALVPDVSQDPRFFGGFDRASGFTTRSIICVPLQKGGRTIGAIEVINKGGSPFDYGDLRILSSLAAPAAIAIENARAYQQAQVRPPDAHEQLLFWGKMRSTEIMA
jgi:GAF domain-containing protein